MDPIEAKAASSTVVDLEGRPLRLEATWAKPTTVLEFKRGVTSALLSPKPSRSRSKP